MAKPFGVNDILNSRSRSATGGAASDFKTDELPIERIIPAEDNIYGIRDIEPLAASIEAIGLLHNLDVCAADGDGNYRITSGERRYHAIKLLYESGIKRWATIPCKIEPQGTPAEERLRHLHANSMTRVLTDYEKMREAAETEKTLRELKAEGYVFTGRMRNNKAKVLGVSASQIGRYESINKNLSPEFLAEFKAENIGVTIAYELSTLNAEEQADMLKRWKETGSFETPSEYKPVYVGVPVAPEPPPSSAALEDDRPTAAEAGDALAEFAKAGRTAEPPSTPPIFKGLDENLEPTDSGAVFISPEPESPSAPPIHEEPDENGVPSEGVTVITERGRAFVKREDIPAMESTDGTEESCEGLKVKYRVYKALDNSPVENYFVLRPDIDAAARAALRAYAFATPNRELAADIRAWLDSLES